MQPIFPPRHNSPWWARACSLLWLHFLCRKSFYTASILCRTNFNILEERTHLKKINGSRFHLIISSTLKRLVLADISIHINKNYNFRHQKWQAIISPQTPRDGLPVTAMCMHQQLHAPSGLENTALLQSVLHIHVPAIRHIPIIFHGITAVQLHMFLAITSMPNSTTHSNFPSHKFSSSAATSGTTMLNFVFG
jgi:hypothetical protein